MIRKTLRVQNGTGLHLRPAGILCEAAGRYACRILLLRAGEEINAKSVLSVLAAGVKAGEELELLCDGADEREAADAITRLFEERFAPDGCA